MSNACLSHHDNQTQHCSAYESLHIARSKASNCLLQTNPQSLNSVIIPSKLPGMTYTADEQCQILFGPTASFCQEMQVRMGVSSENIPTNSFICERYFCACVWEKENIAPLKQEVYTLLSKVNMNIFFICLSCKACFGSPNFLNHVVSYHTTDMFLVL